MVSFVISNRICYTDIIKSGSVFFMFMNVAYLNNSMSAVVDDSRPLIVTCCGNYCIKKRSEVVTHRPKGRRDYQLLYIASGKDIFSSMEKKKRFPQEISLYIYRISHRNMFITEKIKLMSIGCILLAAM